MPFVQRVVQPVHISQACSFISASGNKATKFNCILDTCQHRHYANKKQPLNELHQVIDSSVNTQRERSTHESPALIGETASYRVNVKSGVHLEVSPTEECSPVTKVIVHGNSIETQRSSPHCFDVTDNSNSAVTSSSFASSCYINASETAKHNVYSSLFPTPEIPIKKLKEHVEFLSSATSPVRSQHTSISTSAKGCMNSISTISKSRSAAVIVAGHEFDSISNITLSNALRQLASLVLIASDIFADLHKELRIVGERARVVQNKIITVERSVSDYDPKTVTVPESDLLTIAQRKIHYECDKSYHKELFTIDTRPCSVYVLYEEAGKVTSGLKTHSSQTAEHSSFTGLSSFACDHVINSESPYIRDINCSAFGSNDFSHSPFRVNNLCKMRFDADIEISLPAAIEDLRKWTSTEAVGDVTVTPDCIHHVDALSDAYFLISENATLSLALSPSIPSTDAFDAISVNNINQGVNINNLTNDNNKDVPLNHRLPSPEEQSKIIALKYPAEVISVDVSGKRFQRMCMARKSTTSCISNASNTNNLNSDVQTVSRRSRSRRARGKRRNTIAGTDQKEIQDAASGETTAAGDEIEVIMAESDVGSKEPKYNLQNKTKRFGRSKSSDILKKESATLTYDKGKGTLTRLNSLKQWGRSRFKFMQRNNETPSCSMPVNESDTEHKTCPVSVNTDTKQKNAGDINSATAGVTNSFVENMSHNVVMEKNETVAKQCVNVMEKDRNESRFSHERKPSYSSSEKSVNVNNVGHARGKFHLNPTGGNVKLRDNSSLNRRRNCCLNVNGLSNKEDQPHSSSGNWSASSESGRASIGSEITLQPKSSASNTSLNAFSYQAGSGPPSSMFSRRKFLNTSASSSVTSEGTATPDLQVISTTIESVYSNHLDDETSSAYSCDTEGYYTSFHMDSGLRTLKEEDVCMANFQQGSQPLSLCSYAQDYNSSANNSQQTLIAENEYELFGHGSTSTTTSSAGTVCTTLVGNNTGAELNLNNSGTSCGPELPERVSSLRSSSASASTLERSISSSTIGSGVERTGTIKRNASTVSSTSHLEDMTLSSPNPASQLECASQMEEPKKRDPHHLPVADVDYSESSDLEGIERIERIKQKTAINARHIPSMCIITPTTSDDENQHFYGNDEENNAIQFNKNFQANAAKNKAAKLSLLNTQTSEIKSLTKEAQVKEKSTIDEIKSAIPFIKGAVQMSLPSTGLSVIEDDVLYDTAGEYVYIAADTNNKVNNKQLSQMSKAGTGSSLGIYYANNLTKNGKDLEYVSLNELPFDLRRTHGGSNKGPKIEFSERNKEKSGTHCADAYQIQNSQGTALYADIDELQRETWRTSPCKTNTPPPSTTSSPFVSPHKGARVRLNSVGKPIYDSDSLKRRKGAHTTFIPGPYVKEENESQYTQLQLNNSESDSSAVKLLLLYADNKANYKMAGVKSINNRLTTTRPTISTTSNTNEDGNSHVITCESNKSFLYQQPISNHSLIHSPSTKSNCSSSCSIVSSTTSSSKSSFSSKDEGKLNVKFPSREPDNSHKNSHVNNTNPNRIINKADVAPQTIRKQNIHSTFFQNFNSMKNKSLSKENEMASLEKSTAVLPPPPLPPRIAEVKAHETDVRNPYSFCKFISTPPTTEKSILLEGDLNTKLQTNISAPVVPFVATTSRELDTMLAPSDKLRQHVSLKRNNSYRLANNDMIPQIDKEQNISCALMSPTVLPTGTSFQNILENTSNLHLTSAQNNITKSFERLVDEFSLSTTSIDSSYLRNKSLENFDESSTILPLNSSIACNGEGINYNELNNCNGLDSDSDFEHQNQAALNTSVKYNKLFVKKVLLKPFKIVMPPDDNRRQRILRNFETTDICFGNVSHVCGEALHGVDKCYKPFYQTGGELQKQEEEHGHRELENMCMSYSIVERNSPVYWTLQNKRCNREQMISSISRDDLYATPLKRSDRKLRSSNIERQGNTKNNVSSTVHGNRMGILTSTPMRKDVNDSGAPIKQHSARSLLWDDNSPDRLNTCADRIGHSKTSLMDFKRLLLAKSVKSNTLPKNLSAVEMLKKTNLTSTAHNAGNARTTCANTDTSPGVSPGSPTSKINSSLNLLDLSGSPKTFANRRMLRQGQFGSPSKSFTPKLKNSPGGWRANSALRTDIMSTIIPESNSEEDHSTSATDESNVIKNCGSLKDNSKIDEKEKIGSSENFKRKEKEKNIFLQNEENNFMRGELRSSFGKNKTCFESPAVIMPSTCSENLNASDCNISIPVMTDATIDAIEPSSKFVITPALETAL
uniref:WASP family protein member n=1 Tax=Glossina brevipalpis TaxID=37001 RepID=A0A1A9W725_9MUSC